MPHGILALDLGLTTGWAFGTGEKPPVASSIVFSHLRGDGERGAAFRQWLEAKIEGLDPAIVVREEPIKFHKGFRASVIAHGLAWEVDTTCYLLGCNCMMQPASSHKKHFTGSGNAKKPQVIKACLDRGWPVVDENSADAMALYDFTLAHKFPEDWRRLQAGRDLLGKLPRSTRPIEGL